MNSLLSSSVVIKTKNNLSKHLSFISKRYYKSLLHLNRLNKCENNDLIITRLYPLHGITYRKYKILSNSCHKFVISSEGFANYERNLSKNSNNSLKSLTSLKSETQLKLAQILSKSSIDLFPLLKEKDFDIKHFENKYKDLFKVFKDCEQNNLNNSLYYPSVTTILSATLSVQSLVALNKWEKLKINQLGEQGFKDYQKNLLSRGKFLHMNIKNFIQSRDESTLVINDSIEKLWKSLTPALEHVHDVQLCETMISHPFLYYKGIVDCVAYYSGKLVIIEWKTSEKLKPSLKDIYDTPLQAVAYLGAINYETQHSLPIDEVVLVFAYENGSNAQIHHLSVKQCNQYWKQWLSRVKSYWDLIAFKQTIT